MRRPSRETSMDVNDHLPSGAAADSARALALTELALTALALTALAW